MTIQGVAGESRKIRIETWSIKSSILRQSCIVAGESRKIRIETCSQMAGFHVRILRVAGESRKIRIETPQPLYFFMYYLLVAGESRKIRIETCLGTLLLACMWMSTSCRRVQENKD